MSHAEIFNAVMTALDMYNEGWKPDWEDGTYKYCVTRCGHNIIPITSRFDYHFISFNSASVRRKFMNEQCELLKEFFR